MHTSPRLAARLTATASATCLSGDHLHPNSAGMQAMANTVNLALLTS
ncbi:hypothetical protein [Streptomyces canus]